MIEKHGYVFIARYINATRWSEQVFGPSAEPMAGKIYGNISSNKLKFFSSQRETESSMGEFAGRGLPRLSLAPAKISLTIARDLIEAQEMFMGRKDLIVIAELGDIYEFLGPSQGDSPNRGATINGTTPMYLNGWKNFGQVRKAGNPLEWGRYAVHSCGRQAGGSRARIARFNLRRLT